MKPIGYWLNRTDKAITRHMDDMLGEFGLTRIAWQVLNAVRDASPVTDADVLGLLRANADATTLAAAIASLIAGGRLARPDEGLLALTDEGRALLAEAGEWVDAFRDLSMKGISMEEYRTAVGVLERMTANLEGGPARA
ncbi:MarR family winged helix-turn-helix transcriptional regulator [Actinomadura macrotermitis]|uniref:MarR family transcriptional regulator n=1 Tax=Actinomadura macrotermitis TaxID=2585200 RepID=A0A7K0BXE3_9ACTN|nr:MarR family transcriptional regulator [Actinomadura macrotermitis]MQY05851.1 hypothetical protein [Actinomadura macrotermitis]